MARRNVLRHVKFASLVNNDQSSPRTARSAGLEIGILEKQNNIP